MKDHSPISLAKRLFSDSNVNKYVRSFNIVCQNEATTVVSVALVDQANSEWNCYLHMNMNKERVWEVLSIRRLEMSGFIAQIKDMLASWTESRVESFTYSDNRSKNTFCLFNKREEYDFELNNARLIVASEHDLVLHFNKNIVDFTRMQKYLVADKNFFTTSKMPEINFKDQFRRQLDKVYIKWVKSGAYYGVKNSMLFVVGGLLHNIVGYMFCIEKENLPSIDNSIFIMYRDLGNGWYLFKTSHFSNSRLV